MSGKQRATCHKSKYILWAMLTVVLVLSFSGVKVDQPYEFSLPIPEPENEAWPSLLGAGTKVQYPPGWQGRVYRVARGVRDSARYEFENADQETPIRIVMLEMVHPETGREVMTNELAYWRDYGTAQGYTLEAVTVQGYPAWWIHATITPDATDLSETVWVDMNERVYRLRLHSTTQNRRATVLYLRQLLSTLEVTLLDWSRAPRPAVTLAPSMLLRHTPTAMAGVPYNRGAAFAYAQTYHNVQNNADNCYIWVDSTTWHCTHQPGAEAADGAHFVNRAVAAGGRPIPNQPHLAGLRVADLGTWLQNDGWSSVPVTQALIGDVALIGPASNPCWAGVVVVTGTNPTLATHSDELWAPADILSCDPGSGSSSEKTYWHVDVEYALYLPLIVRNYPPPPVSPRKTTMGIHLGNHLGQPHYEADWPAAMLQPLDGDAGGVWPRAVVIQSNQVYNIWRLQDQPPCNELAGTDFWLGEDSLIRQYLKRATNNGVIVIIRLTPSPGNFEEAKFGYDGWWPPENRTVFERTLHSEPGFIPEGIDYCNGRDHWFRAVDDLAKEMQVIYQRNLAEDWPEDSFYFEPANEPNLEWYTGETFPPNSHSDSWEAMDAYFISLMNYVQMHYSHLQVLTPSMSQGQYAEGYNWGYNYANTGDFCPKQFIVVGGENKTGYQLMESTYTWQANWYAGYSWHNYYIQGRETYQSCENGGFHVSYHFPNFMLIPIATGEAPGFMTETDLCSWKAEDDVREWDPQCYNLNSIHHKEDNPQATADSLNYYVGAEKNMATAVILWLTHNQGRDPETGEELLEYEWHEMYDEEQAQPYSWFTLLWDMAD